MKFIIKTSLTHDSKHLSANTYNRELTFWIRCSTQSYATFLIILLAKCHPKAGTCEFNRYYLLGYIPLLMRQYNSPSNFLTNTPQWNSSKLSSAQEIYQEDNVQFFILTHELSLGCLTFQEKNTSAQANMNSQYLSNSMPNNKLPNLASSQQH